MWVHLFFSCQFTIFSDHISIEIREVFQLSPDLAAGTKRRPCVRAPSFVFNVYLSIFLGVCVLVYGCMCASVCVSVSLCVCVFVCLCICICMCLYVSLCMWVSLCVSACACVCVCVYVLRNGRAFIAFNESRWPGLYQAVGQAFISSYFLFTFSLDC